jgi:hypothetical protein
MRNPKRRLIVVLGLLLLFTLALAACQQAAEQVEVTRVVEVPVEVPGPEVEVTRVVEVEVIPTPAYTIPFEEEWAASPHNAADSEPFVHWNEEDPQEIPESCAKCHSTPGYLDFVGADGSAVNVVDAPAPIGTTIQCEACHNDATMAMTSVLFPSGLEVGGLGAEARCMQCHQGREGTTTVDQRIVDAGLSEGDEDTVSPDLGFANIHYYAAAATLYGTQAKGGYEYAGKSYDAKNNHVSGYDTCVDCHNQHTLEVRLDECVVCHQDVTAPEDLVNIRMAGSMADFDGDGDTAEGVYFEIDGLREMLYGAIQAYANEVAGSPIAYSPDAHPYFFIDANGDGQVGEDEADRYASWTPRLLKAAYNYQVSLKDPGRYAHGGKYIVQLLYDSIESLNEAIAAPVDLSAANRIDSGHFAGSEEAFRHWDAEGGIVPGTCSRCHSADGLPLYIEQGVAINQAASNGFKCETCHNDLTTFTRYAVEEVTFPSGATVALDNPDSNLCLLCHQGRESKASVDRALSGLEDDVVSENIRFRNIHYFAAGATLFGTEVQGAYEYDDQAYNGRNQHVPGFDTCTECHNAHSQEVVFEECADCHEAIESPESLATIRVSEADFDGDGDAAEGLAGEIATMRDALLVAMNGYTAGVGANGIVYDPLAYPYFFNDTNGNGVADPDEANGENGYNTWTPRLLRAAYNFQYSQKDPGAFAHNGQYLIQVLYDSINDMGGDVSAMTRPEVVVPETEG